MSVNSARLPVPLAKSYLLLNHGPVTLVSSAAAGARNVMAAAWVMPLDFDPPKVAIVVDRSTYTRELIEASGELVLNIPPRRLAGKVLSLGASSGRDEDKFVRHQLAVEPATRVAAPLLTDCVAWLECRVIVEPANQQKYDLFLAEVLAAWADPSVFRDGRWHFGDAGLRTMHYQAGGHFFATGDDFLA